MKEFMPEASRNKKMLENVLQASAAARAAKEKDPTVINATAGSFYDEDGKIKVFKSVSDCFENPDYNHYLSYSSVKGNFVYQDVVKGWVLGDDYHDVYSGYHISSIATPGGTGALNLAIGTYVDKGETVLLPNIMWPSYKQIVTNNGATFDTYLLYDDQGKLNVNDIYNKAKLLLEKDGKVTIIVNDPCHNPTGYCMSQNDYNNLVKSLNDLSLIGKVILILDIAYLDFSTKAGTLTRKYFSTIRKLSDNVLVMFAASFSKTLGLYGLRVGALILATRDMKECSLFEESCSFYARSTWSNVTNFGQQIVEHSIANERNRAQFSKELLKTCELLEERSKILTKALDEALVPYCPRRNGFFILLNINDDEFIKELNNYGIYGVKFGDGYRLSLASISCEEARRIGEYIKKIYKK